MLPVILALWACVASLFRSRRSLHLTVLALQSQVAVYQRSGGRPYLHPSDRVFWAWLSRLWTGWQDAVVLPEGEPVQVHVPERPPTPPERLAALEAFDAMCEELTEEQWRVFEEAVQRRPWFGGRQLDR
jgi:glutathione S-transferase